MKLLIHSQTSTVAPLKFGNGWLIPSYTWLAIWSLIHASNRGPWLSVSWQLIYYRYCSCGALNYSNHVTVVAALLTIYFVHDQHWKKYGTTFDTIKYYICSLINWYLENDKLLFKMHLACNAKNVHRYDGSSRYHYDKLSTCLSIFTPPWRTDVTTYY